MEKALISIGIKVIRLGGILVAALGSKKLVQVLAKRLVVQIKKSPFETKTAQKKRLQTIVALVTTTLGWFINLVIVLIVLAELGVDIRPLLAGVGILGLAVSLGAKSLVSDLIAGFFILLENQFNVGDWLQLSASVSGRVVKIGLRTIVLKDREGKIHIVPNSSLKIITKLHQ